MNEEGARWRAQANADLDTARILLDSQRYGPCAFFCQQAAEKGLKAVLYDSGERPWGHSVSSLLDQVCVVLKIDPADAPQVEAQALDEHYMRPRYPDARTEVEADYDQETSLDALRATQIVLDFVGKRTADAGNDSDDAPTADLG